MHEELAPFVGEWTVTVPFSDAPGRTTFEWTLDGAFLIQRTDVPHPEAPNSLIVYAFDADAGRYAQHYFDSRGVVRRYEMSLENGVWKLWRDHPGFSQRWAASFSDDGRTISGAWSKSFDGSTWEHDFDLTYTRVSA
ncbi:DUF1579 family protein [Candidatus Solirubrobacter pratensis]|uniref:DUF1579 family protein n=1 Tax=Candidatus Solirubrobacter pratensis TaxID=1298857 RepID=UPI00041C6B86|nr:DUF1579 family protein [Candidatus Solirubrobacter pratensis]